MGKPTLSGFVIGLIFISMFAGIFAIFISSMATSYGVTDNSDQLAAYDKMTELNNKTMALRTSTTSIKQESGVLDIVGGFFYNAYLVMTTIPDSFDLFYSMSDTALDQANLGAGGEILRTGLVLIVLVLIFIGIVLNTLLKSDRV